LVTAVLMQLVNIHFMLINSPDCSTCLFTVADLGGAKGAMAPPKRQKSPFALMNYIVLQLQVT